MRRQKEWERRLGAAAAALTLGFLIASLGRSILSQQQSDFSIRWRSPIILQRLVAVEEVNHQLRSEVDQLRRKVEEYEKAQAEGKTLTRQLIQEVTRLRVLTGLTRLRGPGVFIRLEDAPTKGPVEQQESPLDQLGLVHDADLLWVVNELRGAGAEAIAINEQRVVGTTAIRCVGNLITVNGERVSSPYEVVAIGDSQKLMSALLMKGGIVEQLQRTGIRVLVTPRQDIIIPSLSVTPQIRFARPS